MMKRGRWGTKIVYAREKNSSRRSRSIRSAVLLVSGAAGVVVLAAGVYALLTASALRITTITVSGGSDATRATVHDFVERYVDAPLVLSLTRKNFFLVSPDRLEHDLASSFPRLQAVSVSPIFPHTLSITLSERVAWGIACGVVSADASTTPRLPADAQCVYVDTSGFAFADAPFLSGFTIKKIFTDKASPRVGQEAISSKVLKQYDGLSDMFQSLSLPLFGYELSEKRPKDIIVFSDGWYALLDADFEPDALRSVMTPLFQTELAGKTDQLEYVDLRFGNKVFYKLKK